MSKKRIALSGMFILMLIVLATACAEDMGQPVLLSGQETSFFNATAPDSSLRQSAETEATRGISGLQVTLAAEQSTTSYDETVSRDAKFELPLLTLHHEFATATEAERSLNVNTVGLEPAGHVRIELVSRHLDVTTGQPDRASIPFIAPDAGCTTAAPCSTQWLIDPATLRSDLYDLQIWDETGALLWSNPQRPDLVMLDTWDLGLDGYTVRIIYGALFPFARGPQDLENRLSPAEVTDFIAHKFVPMVADTWHTQVHEWGFGEPFNPAWDADKLVEIIITAYPFAILDGTGTYTVFVKEDRLYPERRIWWYGSNGSFQRYDSLENGCKVIFAHEFFHLMQWNVLLNTGQPTNHWLNTFIEAQGRLVQSVQHPELELRRDHLVMDHSNFVKRSANRFLTERLNVSVRQMEAESVERYDLAMYWRYLYERYGGMDVVRIALAEMSYQYDTDIVRAIRVVMDSVFAKMGGSIRGHEESLIGFAQATYALRLENGRCASEDLSACAGRFYDPHGMYADPALEARIDFAGGTRTYDGAISASYGMDFVQVSLDRGLKGQPVTVMLQADRAIARFSVQVWELGHGRPKPRALTPQPVRVAQNETGVFEYAIPNLGSECDGLALIITRVDADEVLDPSGSYRVTLSSPVSVDGGQGTSALVAPVDGDAGIAQ